MLAARQSKIVQQMMTSRSEVKSFNHPWEKMNLDEEAMTATTFRWRRLLLKHRLIEIFSESGATLIFMEKQLVRMAQEAKECYEKLAGKKADKSKKPAKFISTTLCPMVRGRSLPRSTTTSDWKTSPELCRHPEDSLSNPRGGRGGLKWFTCLDCGARRERVETAEPTFTPTARPFCSPTPMRSTAPSVDPIAGVERIGQKARRRRRAHGDRGVPLGRKLVERVGKLASSASMLIGLAQAAFVSTSEASRFWG